MNATTRGFIVFLVLIGVLVACAVFSFGVLPGMNVGVAIPVIMVPGEPYDPTLPVESFRWTNTLTAMVLSSLAVIVFAVLAWRDSKGWTKQVPGRYQSWVELLGGFLYGQAKQMAGKNARLLFPLVASIFVFLLAVNWMKLLPGVESVGVLHCAEEGFNGYPMVQIGNGAYQLYVDRPLNGGTGTSHEDYEACEHYKHDPSLKPSKEAVESVADQLEIREAELVERLNVEGILGEAQEPQIAAQRLLAAESLYEHATMPLSAEQLREGAVPYSFVITPYVRGGSTDLNLAIALALISVIAIQVFGVIANGPNYFQKYINLRALGNLGKKPLGAIDFVVGLIEIISELGKIISLAFRLFGNMFAGGILLIVMAFLVSLIVPALFIGLELIVTTIQAYVFAVLTLVFSAQAMEGHHDDGDAHTTEEHHA
ncbi:MAG: FoF1 ATP synthase subunit a [Chloroflexota bacterium]|nr:FoF1 ATP synthase subunit a [Chloroflexota bacterium]